MKIKLLKMLVNVLYIFLSLLLGIIYVPAIAGLLLVVVGLFIVCIAIAIIALPFYYIYYVIKNRTYKGFIDSLNKNKE